MNHNYVIVTDATADLPPAQVRELGIDVVPMTFCIDGNEWTHHPDSEHQSSCAFLDALRTGKRMITSQVNEMTYQAVFTSHLEAGRDILYIGFSSGLSGMYQGAVRAAKELNERFAPNQVVLVDSLCASVGQGLLVSQAAHRQREGWKIHRLERWLGENCRAVSHWFRVEDLMHLKRGGRISPAAAAMGTALQVKPILTTDSDGRLQTVGKIRGRKKSLNHLADQLSARYNPELCADVWICHVEARDEARQLKEMLIARHGLNEIPVLPVGPIIGAHTGPGMVGLVFFGQDRGE